MIKKISQIRRFKIGILGLIMFYSCSKETTDCKTVWAISNKYDSTFNIITIDTLKQENNIYCGKNLKGFYDYKPIMYRFCSSPIIYEYLYYSIN